MKSDYAATAAFVRRLIAKWPEAAVLVWYPLLPEARHRDLLAALAPLPFLRDEVAFDPPPARGMTGSGLALVNAPHGAAAPSPPPAPRPPPSSPALIRVNAFNPELFLWHMHCAYVVHEVCIEGSAVNL